MVWSSYGQDGDQGGIFGRLVRTSSLGSDPLRAPFLREEIQIAEVGDGHQRNPLVTADSGGFWTAWETVDANGLSSILSLRRLSADGRPEAPEVRLAAPVGEQRRLVALENPTPESVTVRWWGQDSWGRSFNTSRQEVVTSGALGLIRAE